MLQSKQKNQQIRSIYAQDRKWKAGFFKVWVIHMLASRAQVCFDVQLAAGGRQKVMIQKVMHCMSMWTPSDSSSNSLGPWEDNGQHKTIGFETSVPPSFYSS